jgi:uncharacterized YigZ family protein
MTVPGDSPALLTITGSSTSDSEIKKSRFIAHAAPAESPADAMAFIGRAGDPDATHNCWAYRIGPAYRFCDDGEPAGTAGRPILAAIERQRIDHVVVVVTRFFGGIKLGAGGLARAYGGVAASCLRKASTRELEAVERATMVVPFASIGLAYSLAERRGLNRRDDGFTEQGATITVAGAASLVSSLIEDLTDATSGAIVLLPAQESGS